MPNCYNFDELPDYKKFLKYEVSTRLEIEKYFHNEIERYGLPGFQNLSTLPRIQHYIDEKFITEQDKYLISICERFLKNHVQ